MRSTGKPPAKRREASNEPKTVAASGLTRGRVCIHNPVASSDLLFVHFKSTLVSVMRVASARRALAVTMSAAETRGISASASRLPMCT